MTFDESNGSQGEQVVNVVGSEEPSSKAIKKLATGEVKPQEQVDQDEDDGLMFHGPSTSTGQTIRTNEEPSTSNQDQPQVEQEVEPIQHQDPIPHPRILQTIQKDHPVDNILGSISKGVTTRSRLATFCEYYSFVFSLEPLKVDEALNDPDWVMAMQEELNTFTQNEVWSLVERPKQNIIGTKWVF